MSIWDASLHTANRWFDISWYGLLGAGCIAALAALATVGFLLLQFWSSAVREKHVALDIAGAAKEAALANEGAAKANERAASLEKESEMLRGENLALQNIMRPRRLPTGGGFSDKYEELAKFAGTPAVIFVVADLASQVFAGDIWNVLKNANWKVDERGPRVITRVFSGLNVYAGVVTEAGPLPPKNPDKAWLAGAVLADLMTAWGLGQGTFPVNHSPQDILPTEGAFARPDGTVAIAVGLPDMHDELMMLNHLGPPKNRGTFGTPR
jgi:hypothetical protein